MTTQRLTMAQALLKYLAALRVEQADGSLLATLVENAVKHGIEPMAGGGAISVDVECVAPHLRISVTDTGVGLTGQTEASGGGMGLANTADRLRSLYGDAARLTVEAAPGGGVVASLIIPLGAPAQLESSVR